MYAFVRQSYMGSGRIGNHLAKLLIKTERVIGVGSRASGIKYQSWWDACISCDGRQQGQWYSTTKLAGFLYYVAM